MVESVERQAAMRQLEKENRILRKKLERSHQNCVQLEETNQRKETLLRQAIAEVKDSRQAVEEKQQLEQTLAELRRTQAQLIQAEKMSSLGQLVAGVAHEINNPANFIYGNLLYIQDYVQTLLEVLQSYQQHYPDPPTAVQELIDAADLEFLQDDLSKVVRSMQVGTERIRQIVLSLRNFSRLDESELKATDLHEGLNNTLLILQHRLRSPTGLPEIEVIREYANLPRVRCYAGQLNQVFANILSNAIDALQAEGAIADSAALQKPRQIVIRTALMAEQVEVTIADNGIGIPPAAQQQIFNPFFTTKPVGKGTGLGLAISYQIIVERHRGRLKCQSTPGEGTTFSIQIPIQQPSG